MGPREFYRQRFKLPIIAFVDSTLDMFKAKTKKGASNVSQVLFRGTLVALITSTLVWLSIFMYLAFYYAYVPIVSHERPVHLTFAACIDSKGICSFPNAHVELTKKQQLLMIGQPYRIQLELEMPESPVNKELGMFMVCVEFLGKKSNSPYKAKELLTTTCRSTMLHYRSTLLELVHTAVYIPFFLFGTAEEKQHLIVELFSEYEELESSDAVTDVHIEIQSRDIQLYSAKFLINARFSGLRYFMFNWPVLSAAIGITSNLFFIAIICIICWYQIVHSEEYRLYVLNKDTDSLFIKGSHSEDSGSSSSEEESYELTDKLNKTSIEDVK